MPKMQLTFVTVCLLAFFGAAHAAEIEPLGSIWREGETDDKAWLIGTLRSVPDLELLAAQEANPGADKSKDSLHPAFFRFETECSGDDFNVRVKANAFGQEKPMVENETGYEFEDSPLREASIVVNGQSSLNLHYLWGAISGSTIRPDDRTALAGSVYRFLTQINNAPKAVIGIYTPNGYASYLLDKSYLDGENGKAVEAFEKKCAKFVSSWH